MPVLEIDPVVMSADSAMSPSSAFQALAAAACQCLGELDAHVQKGKLPKLIALTSRVRGTGPGVSFGNLVNALLNASVGWICPFEGCMTVRGSLLRGKDLVSMERDDAFLVLQFDPNTLDLPLHTHEDSDRFIIVIDGRGFFHASPDPLESGSSRRLRHTAVRDRDTVMFRRGTVHTFSTGEHPLTILSYHRPYISLADERQYTLSSKVEKPANFLKTARSEIVIAQSWSTF